MMVRSCVRHTASFAALTWYLMVPPLGNTGNLNLNVEAPYSLWRTYRVYDTKKQCDDEQIAIVEKVKALLREPANKRYADLINDDATSSAHNSSDVLNARGFLGSLLTR